MTFNDRMKIFKRTMARNGLFFCTGWLNAMPYSLVKAVTGALIAIGFALTIRLKQISRESLQIAFGQTKSKKEIEDIVRKCFDNFGKGMVELIYFMAHPPMIKEKVRIEGKERLDEALKGGKGVILVSAHFGNFPLMLLRLAQEGYKINAIIRSTRDPKIEEYFFKQRSQLGLNTIYSQPRKQCVDNTIRALRNNELVFIPLDQNFGNGAGVFVDFFGHQAATATGPVVFAQRTGAPILPIFVVREKDDDHLVTIEPQLILEERATDDEMVRANVAKITKLIETYIRRYPHEWGWMHRRWKSKPSGSSEGRQGEQQTAEVI
jgi:KDO2-lipid IV(A) lauroyltransferase